MCIRSFIYFDMITQVILSNSLASNLTLGRLHSLRPVLLRGSISDAGKTVNGFLVPASRNTDDGSTKELALDADSLRTYIILHSGGRHG